MERGAVSVSARLDDQPSQSSIGDLNGFSYNYEAAFVEDLVKCRRASLSALINKRICKLGAKFLGISQSEGEEDQRSLLAAEG